MTEFQQSKALKIPSFNQMKSAMNTGVRPATSYGLQILKSTMPIVTTERCFFCELI